MPEWTRTMKFSVEQLSFFFFNEIGLVYVNISFCVCWHIFLICKKYYMLPFKIDISNLFIEKFPPENMEDESEFINQHLVSYIKIISLKVHSLCIFQQ